MRKGHLTFLASEKIGLKDTKMKNRSRCYVIIQNIFSCIQKNGLVYLIHTCTFTIPSERRSDGLMIVLIILQIRVNIL